MKVAVITEIQNTFDRSGTDVADSLELENKINPAPLQQKASSSMDPDEKEREDKEFGYDYRAKSKGMETRCKP